MPKNKNCFPMFISLEGRKIVVAGGGKIGTRRVKTLIDFDFGADIVVVSPTISEELEVLLENGAITYIGAPYSREVIKDAFIVLACTDDREMNRTICGDCKEAGIVVNNAGEQELCDFQFPGIAQKDQVLIAFNGGGKNHRKVKEMRQIVESCLQISKKDGVNIHE